MMMDRNKMWNIGLLFSRQTSEVLWQTCVISALRQHFPHANVVAIVHDLSAPLLANNPSLDQVLQFSREKAGASVLARIRRNWDFLSVLGKARLDVIIDLNGGDRAAIQAWSASAPIRVSFSPLSTWPAWKKRAYTHFVERPSESIPAGERYMRLLEPLGIPSSTVTEPILRLTKGELRHAKALKSDLGGDYAIINLSLLGDTNLGKPESLAELVDWIHDKAGLKTALLCGSSEREAQLAAQVEARCSRKSVSVSKTPLVRDQAVMVSAGKFFIGCESGLIHIAGVLGVQSVILLNTPSRPNCGTLSRFFHFVQGQPAPSAKADNATTLFDIGEIKQALLQIQKEASSKQP